MPGAVRSIATQRTLLNNQFRCCRKDLRKVLSVPRKRKTDYEGGKFGQQDCIGVDNPHAFLSYGADQMKKKPSIEEQNELLLTEGDESDVYCETHNFRTTFGQLNSIGQLALLSGLDQVGDKCILQECLNER